MTTVSQEAREAAADLYLALDGGSIDPSDIAYADAVRKGRCDDCAAVQAFAKFGQSIRQSAERGEAWRPIETAPKDGTEFQAWAGGQWEPRCRINPETEAFEVWQRIDYDIEGWDTYYDDCPIWWMPCPNGPTLPNVRQLGER